MAAKRLIKGLTLALALTACAAPATQSGAQTAAVAPAPPKPGRLPVEPLSIETSRGPVRFTVEVAADDISREYGLMFRRSMPAGHGMIFDFKTPQPTAFWMRNTYIPLDILYVGADGRILNIAKGAKPFDESPLPSAGPVRAVIEINAGLSDKLGIQPGDRVRDQRVFGRG